MPGYTTLNRMAGVTSVRRRCLPPATFDIEFSGWVPTLELTVYVRAQPAPGPVRVLQRAQLVTGGRVDQTCLIWDRTGRLVAEGTQLAAIRLGWFPFLRPGRHGRGVPGVLEDEVEAGRGPAVRPAAAAVITCARGSARLPVTHAAGMAVASAAPA